MAEDDFHFSDISMVRDEEQASRLPQPINTALDESSDSKHIHSSPIEIKDGSEHPFSPQTFSSSQKMTPKQGQQTQKTSPFLISSQQNPMQETPNLQQRKQSVPHIEAVSFQ